MKIIHTFIKCISCKLKLEVFDEDRRGGQVDCPNCGYTNELTDKRLRIWDEEF